MKTERIQPVVDQPSNRGASPLLKYVEVAARLKCCVKTVQNLVKAGGLRVTRVGRLARVAEADLADCIQRCASGVPVPVKR